MNLIKCNFSAFQFVLQNSNILHSCYLGTSYLLNRSIRASMLWKISIPSREALLTEIDWLEIVYFCCIILWNLSFGKYNLCIPRPGVFKLHMALYFSWFNQVSFRFRILIILKCQILTLNQTKPLWILSLTMKLPKLVFNPLLHWFHVLDVFRGYKMKPVARNGLLYDLTLL